MNKSLSQQELDAYLSADSSQHEEKAEERNSRSASVGGSDYDHCLPAYYLPPTQSLEQATHDMAHAIRGAVSSAALAAAIRRQIANEADRVGYSDPDVPRARKGLIWKSAEKQVLANAGLDEMPVAGRILITGTQGIGKTHTALSAIATLRGPMVVWFLSPTLAKSAEAAAEYDAKRSPDSLPGTIVRGRSAKDPEHNTAMCPRHEVAAAMAATTTVS